jgi:F-type H+-transporting ATPase subunit alpha
MQGIRVEEISDLIKKRIEEYEKKVDLNEMGVVISIGDGIARVYGLRNCQAMELIEFPGERWGSL